MLRFYDLFIKMSPNYKDLSGVMRDRLLYISERMDIIREMSDTKEASLSLLPNESAVIIKIVTEGIEAFKEEKALYEIINEADGVKMYNEMGYGEDDSFTLELKLTEKN